MSRRVHDEACEAMCYAGVETECRCVTRRRAEMPDLDALLRKLSWTPQYAKHLTGCYLCTEDDRCVVGSGLNGDPNNPDIYGRPTT